MPAGFRLGQRVPKLAGVERGQHVALSDYRPLPHLHFQHLSHHLRRHVHFIGAADHAEHMPAVDHRALRYRGNLHGGRQFDRQRRAFLLSHPPARTMTNAATMPTITMIPMSFSLNNFLLDHGVDAFPGGPGRPGLTPRRPWRLPRGPVPGANPQWCLLPCHNALARCGPLR